MMHEITSVQIMERSPAPCMLTSSNTALGCSAAAAPASIAASTSARATASWLRMDVRMSFSSSAREHFATRTSALAWAERRFAGGMRGADHGYSWVLYLKIKKWFIKVRVSTK